MPSVAHLHLLLNHVPVIGTIGLVLIFGYAIFLRSDDVARMGLILAVLVGVTTGITLLTGEPAADTLRAFNLSRSLVHAHEEAAEAGAILTGIAGALAFASLLVFRGRSLPIWVVRTGLAASLACAIAMGYVGMLGGRIRHPEVWTPPAGLSQPAASERDHSARDPSACRIPSLSASCT